MLLPSLLLAVLPGAPGAPNASAPTSQPSVAVFPIQAGSGLSGADSSVLGDTLVELVRARGTFSRVVSMDELKTLVGLEQQRQLVSQCDEKSCLAEVAAALGVDLVLTGSLAQLGNVRVLNLKLLSTDNGLVMASTSVQGPVSSQVLHMLATAVDRVLNQSGHRRAALAVEAGGAADGGGGPVPLMLAAGAALGAVPAGVLALVAGSVGLGALVVPYVVHVPTPFLTSFEARRLFFPGVGAGGMTLAAVLSAGTAGLLVVAAVVAASTVLL